ncbi:caspase-3b [Nematolebias whitei]|uniref:caspase-3b n=1 Tax=Nematolebias whitei TaxID=451745 RepID=UPI001897EC71|nr:caspase-3b [Nematolebias whitei]
MAEVSRTTEEQSRPEDSVDTFKWLAAAGDVKKVEETASTCCSSDSKPVVKDPHRYNMEYPCIGTCLIINNKNFHRSTKMDFREGTDVDATSVQKTFKRLGYKISVFNDQSVEEMKRQMERVSQEDHSQSASFVCVLLSHGKEGVIYGTDGVVSIDTLIGYFKGYKCLSLVGKPKLFFIQACRGSAVDDGVTIETDSVEEQTTEKIPVEADFLYAYSTAPGYFSWRNPLKGSWFIQSLCETLEIFKGELDLMQILTRVNNKVARHFKSFSNFPVSNKKQIPCIVSMLTKDFYFPK